MVMGKEQLRQVKFRSYADNTILDLSFQPFDETPYEGAIVFKWEYDVEVMGENVYSIFVDLMDENHL